MRFFLVCLGLMMGVGLISCGTSRDTLRVRQFNLQDTKPSTGHEFIRSETNRRLHGAVSEREREERLGQYYDVSWQKLSGVKPVKVVFEYRQIRTGAKVRKQVFVRKPAASGKFEIQVTGANYRTNGRVLAWQMSLYDGAEKVAVKRSYLWN